MGKTKLISLFIIFLLCALSSGAYAASIGLSPGIVRFEGVLRGDYAEKSIVLSTSSSESIDCEISASGPAALWFDYGTGSRFTIAPKSHFSLKIMVEPPSDTPNGVYEGIITVRIIPKQSSSGGVGTSISTGVGLKYSIEVSDQEKKSFNVSSMSMEYTLEGVGYTEEKKSLNFLAVVFNNGNVRLYPKIKVDVLSEDKGTILKSTEYSEKLLLPTTQQEFLIGITPNDLSIGKYYARFTAYQDDKKVYEAYQRIEVVEKGSLSIIGRLEKVELNKIWVNTGELVEVKAIFINDGVLSTSAQFKGKVSKINEDEGDSVVSLLESDEIDVEPGKTAEITTYYTPTSSGRYLISGRVRYSKKETSEKSSILNVMQGEAKTTTTETTQPETTSSGDGNMVMVAVATAIVLLIVSVLMMKNRKGRKGASG